jgi:hypothetical protein
VLALGAATIGAAGAVRIADAARNGPWKDPT